jgi:hypothetical protein
VSREVRPYQNVALRRWGYQYEQRILGEYNNEIEGLLSEIKHIEMLDTISNPLGLNENTGGQGNQFVIVERKNALGEMVLLAEYKQ